MKSYLSAIKLGRGFGHLRRVRSGYSAVFRSAIFSQRYDRSSKGILGRELILSRWVAEITKVVIAGFSAQILAADYMQA
jgi:hypothetical protein